mgnify:CR=1 FL=1
MLRGVLLLLSVLAVALLQACTSDAGFNKYTADEFDTIAILESGESLEYQTCVESKAGVLLYVTDSAQVYFCDGEVWHATNGVDLPEEDLRTDTLLVKRKYTKKDSLVKIDTLRIADTLVVFDTLVGVNGADCSVDSVENGYKIVCGGDSVGVVLNGAMGKDGADGKDGEDGTDGKDGKNGTDGLSAYEIAKKNGFKGTEKEWLESLVAPNRFGVVCDKRDGQCYKTVKIGDQVWMAQNLNYAYTGVKFSNGLYTSDSTSWCYDNEPSNCAKYGRLYTWSAAMDSAAFFSNDGKGCGYGVECESSEKVRGVCPEGWHLPSREEWRALFIAVGGQDKAGTALKSQTGWNYDGNGMDAYGFSALPAGISSNSDSFEFAGLEAHFWSASEYYSSSAYYMYLRYNYEFAYLYNYDKGIGYSVRCLQDSN